MKTYYLLILALLMGLGSTFTVMAQTSNTTSNETAVKYNSTKFSQNTTVNGNLTEGNWKADCTYTSDNGYNYTCNWTKVQ